jgi:hypothetical protein
MVRKRAKLALFCGIAVLAMVILGVVGSGPVYDKVVDLRYRFQLLERRVGSLGEVQSAALVRHQAARGDARFDAPSVTGQDSGNWALIGGNGIAGSWPGGHFIKTKALAVLGDDLYVGLLAPERGEAAIWHFDGTVWTRIADADRIPEWRTATYVQSLRADRDRLYAGVDNRVWQLSDGLWSPVTDADGSVPWPDHANTYALTIVDGEPVVGLTGGAARVFRHVDGRWAEMSEGLPQSFADGIYELHQHDDGQLYAGVMSIAGPGLVYRRDGDHWLLIGGGGVQGSWLSPGSNYPLSFSSYQGQLVVTLNRNPQVAGNFVSIWALREDQWHPVGAPRTPGSWAETDNFNASLVYRNRLVVGAGGRPASNAGVWVFDADGQWREFGGHGVNGSWSADRARMSGSRHATAEYVYRLIEWRGLLVAGFGDATGAAQVWAFTPDNK